MQNTKLIGYPHAGSQWIEPRLTSYALIAQGHNPWHAKGHGDITGAQGRGTGPGHGPLAVVFSDGAVSTVPSAYVRTTGTGSATLYKTKLMRRGPRKGQTVRVAVLSKRRAVRGDVVGKAARSTGTGLDADTQRAMALESWLSPLFSDNGAPNVPLMLQRQRILAEIATANDLAARLQAIGARAARRQARRLVELRGVKPSDTSVQDAEQDAFAGVLTHVRRLDKCTAQHWASMRFVRVIALYAGRAAFKSLCAWARVGMSGDTAGTSGNWCEFVQDALDTLHAQDPMLARDEPHQGLARRAVVRWVFHVGLRQFAAGLPADMRGTARASAVTAARRRCRVVGSIIFGASLVDACEQAGFGSAKAFQQSCEQAGFWKSLRAARAASLHDVPSIATARGWQRAYALDAALASRALAALGSAGAWQDTLSTDTLRASTARGVKQTARVLERRAVLSDLRDATQWATYFKRRAEQLTLDNLRAFDRIGDKLKSGAFQDLRAATVGKTHKGVQSALITRARGKVSRPVVLAPTVAVQVATRHGARKLQCAPSASPVQPWAMTGDTGFTVCHAGKA